MKKQDYIQANRDWLSAKAYEVGVEKLADGVYYKVLQSGDPEGKQPTERSIITAHYTGYTVDGKQFDSSVGSDPLTIRLRQLISGWIVALQQMRIGDKWEIYISAEQGYGARAMAGIPAGSTLIFEIELLGIA